MIDGGVVVGRAGLGNYELMMVTVLGLGGAMNWLLFMLIMKLAEGCHGGGGMIAGLVSCCRNHG
jgi:hypothetical protein